MPLPLHRLALSVHASGLGDVGLICDSLAWLVGGKEMIEVEETKSFHNSPMYIITAASRKKGEARRALPRIGASALKNLLSTVEKRIDDENNLHFRLSLDDLVQGNVTVDDANSNEVSVKGRCKLEVYPGDKTAEVAERLLTEAIDVANRKGYPPEIGETFDE